MRRTALLAAVLVLPLAGCGDDDEGGGGDGGGGEACGGGSEVTVVAESISGFDCDAYTATAGDVTFIYENADSAPHTLVIEEVDDFKLQVSGSGDSEEGSVSLEAGEYVLYCDIPGHRGAGMEADLTVE